MTLLAARDRLGSYPLFYAETAGDLCLSNSIEALLAEPDVPDAVNVLAVADHLRHRWPVRDETYFEAVRRVPPGHAMLVKDGSCRISRYWDPAPSGAVDWVQADELDRFDALFEDAVDRCLVHGPAGIFLSGGLDSVSVAAVAAASCRRRGHPYPWALSLSFPDPESNEEPRQRAVAAALELPQVVMAWEDAVAPAGLVPAALDLNAVSPAPLLNLWMPAYDRLALQGRARGCSVILTGNGGDEWLSVSPYYAADLIRNFDVRGLYRLFHEHRRSHRVASLLYLRNLLWRFGARPLLVDRAKRALSRSPSLLRDVQARRMGSRIPEWLAPDPELRRSLVERSLETHTTRELRTSDRRHPRIYIREMRSGMDHPLVAMELEELQEQGRRLGVRVLQPFWDATLVEFLYRTPPALLNRGGLAKGLVRETVARRFPKLGFETQRKLTATRFARSVLLHEGGQAWQDVRGATALGEAGIVDTRALNQKVDRVLRDPESREFHVVWDVLALETWLRTRRQTGGEPWLRGENAGNR